MAGFIGEKRSKKGFKYSGMNDNWVDVNIAVYNHAPYLRKTLESVLEQKTNFPFRLLIGDDCSTDGSIEILKEFEKKYPDKIKVIYQPKNLGLDAIERNGIILLKNSTAKYIALLDGDDYWINPNKLQKQVDFLEAKVEFEGVSCNVFEKIGDNLNETKNKLIIDFEDLAKGNPLYTCSVLFRSANLQIPPWFSKCKMGDWILWLLLASKGPIFNMDDVMCVYRIHGSGTWSGKSTETNIKDILNAYEILLKNIKEVKQRKMLAKGANQYYIRLLRMLYQRRSNDFLYWFRKSFLFNWKIANLEYLLKYFYKKAFTS
jgi:glycosyltransferase involved in cell wall biosynthesis